MKDQLPWRKNNSFLIALIKALSTDKLALITEKQEAINFIESFAWPNGPVSPFVEKSKVYKIKNGRYKCKESRKIFTVRTYTVFHNTKIKLIDWLKIIHVLTSKKISSHELGRQFSLTQRSAYLVIQRLEIVFSDLGAALEEESRAIRERSHKRESIFTDIRPDIETLETIASCIEPGLRKNSREYRLMISLLAANESFNVVVCQSITGYKKKYLTQVINRLRFLKLQRGFLNNALSLLLTEGKEIEGIVEFSLITLWYNGKVVRVQDKQNA